jgi:outer membrane lipoprotein SlyB
MVATGSMVFIPPSAAIAAKTVRCKDCGTVLTTNRKDAKGSGTTGAVVGGVGGAVAGKTLGDSNTAAVLGGVGGALAGNMIGKKMTNKKIWSVEVKMDNGPVRDFDYDTDPQFSAQERVRVVDGRLERL